MSAFNEGNRAGYLGLADENPYKPTTAFDDGMGGVYRSGAVIALPDACAAEWEAGYAAGREEAAEDLWQKRVGAAR